MAPSNSLVLSFAFASVLALLLAPNASAIDLFSAAEPHAVGDLPMGLAVGDLDGVGTLDVAVANRMSNDVSIVFDAAGTALEVRVALGAPPRSVAIGDLTGDGHADILVGRELTTPPIALLVNQGGGTFAPPLPFGTLSVFPDAIWIGDLDADADPDVVLAGASSNRVVVFLNGDGTFVETPYEIGTAPAYPSDLAVGDADDDGDLDLLVTASLSPSPPVLLLNSGGGTFVPAPPFTEQAAIFVSAAIGDLAGDGTAELVLLSSASLAVFSHEGAGSFGDPVYFSIGASTQPGGRVRLGDLDADGHLDAVVGLFLQNPTLPVLIGDDAGGFLAPAPYPAGAAAISAVVLADLDADGDLDLAATSKDDDLLAVLRNQSPTATSVPIDAAAFQLSLAPPHPNPGRAPTIAFHLPRPAHARLDVVDVAGRRVAGLLDGVRAAGEHRLEWFGRAADGGPAAAGVYMVRLEVEGRRLHRKIVLTR